MNKKELGKKAWNKTKKGLSYAVGLTTGVVATSVCMAFAPQEAGRIASVAFKVGTAGVSSAAGFCAQQITEQEINYYEKGAVAFVNNHRNQNKVKVEIVK